jgi:hypothetical protein
VTLSLLRGLMRRFGAIVRVRGRVVGERRHEVVIRDTVAVQLVGDEPTRGLSLAPQESAKDRKLRQYR